MDRVRNSLRRWMVSLGAMIVFASTIVAAPATTEEDAAIKEKALALNSITGNEAMASQMKAFLKDPEGTKKLIAVAVGMAKEKDQPFNYNAAVLLARAARVQKDIKAAETFYRVAADKAKALQSTEKLIDVYDGLLDLYFQGNKYEDAVRTAQQFLDLDGTERLERVKPFIKERLIQALARQGKINDALEMTQELVDADVDGWYFLNLKAWIQREAGKYDDSATTYQEVLKRLRKSDLEDDLRERYTERVRYTLSGVYVDMNQIDKAVEQLRLLVKKRPDNTTYNNDLGYIMADNDMELDESERLIRKAIEDDRKEREKLTELPEELNKDNPAYLDSLGWVLYKKKNYAEAKKHLLEAVKEEEGQHIEILDHLADTHMALGEKEEAIKVWEQAMKLENLTKREEKRKLQVEEKLKKAKGAE